MNMAWWRSRPLCEDNLHQQHTQQLQKIDETVTKIAQQRDAFYIALTNLTTALLDHVKQTQSLSALSPNVVARLADASETLGEYGRGGKRDS
jgi:hypothetical protein